MRCDACREALSARLDGVESADLDGAAVDAHLTGCGGCRRWAADAERLHRSMRLRPADPVPDLTSAIMAAAPAVASRGPLNVGGRLEWARYCLLVVAVTRLLLALPVIVFGESAGVSVHAARELASWDMALAVGLLVVAWRPRLAPGMLAFAATLAAALVVTTTIDVVAGRVAALGESTHALDLAGIGLVWLLARRPGPQARRLVHPGVA
jgi:predicted anti-sigma-YlaC factor YlaD